MSTLFVVGTPIGNLEDMTYRAVRTLTEVDLIACEDTRTTRKLLSHYTIKTPTTALYQGKEHKQTEGLIARLQSGESIALVSDAGMPAISDPGYPLLNAAVENEITIDVIPGPSAVTTGLLLSGLPPDAFRFYGFLPRKGQARAKVIDLIAESEETCVIFESPKRTRATIVELAKKLGETRPAAVTRELTKLYQEAIRGSLGELVQTLAKQELRGEVTLIIGGRTATDMNPETLHRIVKERVENGQSPKEISLALSEFGKRKIYQLALALIADETD